MGYDRKRLGLDQVNLLCYDLQTYVALVISRELFLRPQPNVFRFGKKSRNANWRSGFKAYLP